MASTQDNLNEIKKRMIEEWIQQEKQEMDRLQEQFKIHLAEIKKYKLKLRELEA